MLTALLLRELGATSADAAGHPASLGEEGQPLRPGDELSPGRTFRMGCNNW